MEANFRLIQEMGWSRTEAQEALTAAGGNLQTALDWLLTNCPQGRVGTGEASPSPNTQGNKTPSNEIDSNWVPPPPLDSSDHENARHLEALKRNHSNDVLVHPDGEHGAPTQAPNRPASSSSPSGRDATSSGPSQSPTVDSEPIVLSAGTASSSSLMANAPMIQVCYRSNSDMPTLAERDKLFDLLKSEHMPCVLVDINENRDLEDILVSAGLSLPQAVLSYQPLGDLRDFSQNLASLRRFVARKIAAGLQSEHSNTIDEYSREPVSTGAVDGVMNLLASAASAIWNKSTSASTRPAQSFIEFTVIKTNWFYRDQRRIIRFGTKGDFYRIDPKNNELRESVPYNTISGIAVAPGRITLTLKGGLTPTFHAPVRVIDYMYQLFLAYCPDEVTPKIEAA